jgi:serine/threonine protein kinase
MEQGVSNEVRASVAKAFLLEAKILMEFTDGPNVLKLVGVTTSKEPWYIVTQLAEFGDLHGVLKRCKASSVSLRLDEQLSYGGQISVGMRYLARRQFIHRDLASRNCLVMEKGVIQIGDFGMSRVLGQANDYVRSTQDEQLPLRWMAVESIMFQKFTVRTDVWAYGVTLWEIFTYADRPYGDTSNHVIGYQIQKGTRPERPAGCTDEVHALMEECWADEPEKRPTFGGIAERIEVMEKAARAAVGGVQPRCIGELSLAATPDISASPYRTVGDGDGVGNYRSPADVGAEAEYRSGANLAQASEYARFSVAQADSSNYAGFAATYSATDVYSTNVTGGPDNYDIYAGADAIHIPDPPPGMVHLVSRQIFCTQRCNWIPRWCWG